MEFPEKFGKESSELKHVKPGDKVYRHYSTDHPQEAEVLSNDNGIIRVEFLADVPRQANFNAETGMAIRKHEEGDYPDFISLNES